MRDAVHRQVNGPSEFLRAGRFQYRVRYGKLLRHHFLYLIVVVGDDEFGFPAVGVEEKPSVVMRITKRLDVAEHSQK